MVTIRTLDNGIKVALESISYVRSISFGIWVKNGSRNELPQENGVSHYIEHMMFKGKPLLVPLAMNAENKAAQKKLDGPISFAGKDTQLLASSPRKLFLEKTEAYNAQVKAAIEQTGQKKA